MSYQVIARKWRPRTFDELAGQDHVVRTLKNSIAQNRVHHAYLFTGARGVGKTSAARIFARALNCVNGPTVTPCGVCDACVTIAAGQSLDVLEIDGASNRGIDAVRELRDQVRYAPAGGKRKIIIIDEVHMLTTEAFNALLKTLEEPPAHVVFIFATTEPQKILDTILSRCQRFDFKRLPARLIGDQLKKILGAEGRKIAPEALAYVVRAAAGSMRDSQSLLDQVLSFSAADISEEDVRGALGLIGAGPVARLANAALAGDADGALAVSAEVYGSGHDMKQLLDELLWHYHRLLIARVCKAPENVLDAAPGELQMLQDEAARAPRALILRQTHILTQAAEEMARALDGRILMDTLIVRMCESANAAPVDEWLRRLEELEAQLGAGPKKKAPA
ncbi:MAG: hypothetical protein GMKNLPBB_01769 [Myxococcota bacterium]|nr:hypothetical protein [Myxococcota bacterium]